MAAGDVSVTHNFANTTTAEAPEVNTNFSDLVSWINTNAVCLDGSRAFTALPTAVAGTPTGFQLVTRTAGDALYAALAGFTTWVPVVDQNGAVASTNTRSRWTRLDDLVVVSFNVAVTAAGTSGFPIKITNLPVDTADINFVMGFCKFYDASADVDRSLFVGGVTGDVDACQFFWDPAAAGTSSTFNPWGTHFALASGDLLTGFAVYEGA